MKNFDDIQLQNNSIQIEPYYNIHNWHNFQHYNSHFNQFSLVLLQIELIEIEFFCESKLNGIGKHGLQFLLVKSYKFNNLQKLMFCPTFFQDES